jgi:porin
MKKAKYLIAAALCCTGQFAHSQFTFEASYIGDAYYNARGGLSRGGGFMGMGNICVGFDTHEAGLWRGGSLLVNGAGIHGRSLTENFLGDLQVASNIDAGEHAYLHELWYRQTLGPVTLTVGLQDLNAEFMVAEGGGEFVNSSFGTPSVIALGVPVPIFPLTGLGAAARWDISDRWAVQGALFDGVQTDFERNPHNVRWALGRGDGVLAMSEVHFDGRYKLGAYYHSAEGNYGFHLSVDQPLGDRVGLFGQAVLSPQRLNDNNFYLGLGCNLRGVFSRRHRDALGLAIAHAALPRAARSHETAIEFYYKYNLTENITLQPDFQYILNPSGHQTPLSNALVGIFRFCLAI